LAFDYRLYNVTPSSIIAEGYRDVVLSWRQNDDATARAHLDTFRAAGVRIWITIDPWVHTSFASWDVKSGWPSDDALWDLAQTHNAWLRADDPLHPEFGQIRHPVPEFWSDTFGRTRGLDFSVLAFAAAWANWIQTRWGDISGVYHDYGFPSDGLSWVNGYTYGIGGTGDGVLWPGNWQNWAAGYRHAFDTERAANTNRSLLLGQYGNAAVLNPDIPPRATGVIIEGIGNVETPSFFTYIKAWQICREAKVAGIRPMLWCLYGGGTVFPPVSPPTAEALRNRRAIACMAVATYGFMEWRWGDPLGGVHLWPNHRIPELMDLTIGTTTWPGTELATNVWLVTGSQGYVVINLSSSPYSYGGYTVAVDDGLMVQTHDALGNPIAPLTNVGI
jgi:hypothetical protein